ncbi:ABC transporter ATP-binding protein, partial [Candidatus Woesearchaeota archaeon]
MSYPILIKNVYKSLYEKGKLSFSLKNINLTVKKGSSFALLGPNGAGKTTLIYLILGLLKPDKGTIHIFGKNPLERDALARVNFMMTEQYEPWALKVKNILNFYAEVYNIPNKHQKINELCEIFNLKKLMNKSLYKLSSGEQTRVMLARALINDPKLLILDEPTHNLDSYSAEKIRDFLLEMNRR